LVYIFALICSLDFDEEAECKSMQEKIMNYSPKKERKLKKDAVPTLLLPHDTDNHTKEKNLRVQKRERILDLKIYVK